MVEKSDATSTNKIFKLSDVEAHKSRESCWMVIHNKVYDVTKFLDEHPGGEEILLEQSGADATEAFEDVGHSTDARDNMADFYLGELCEEDKKYLKESKKDIWSSNSSDSNQNNTNWTSWIVPIGLAVTATLFYRLYFLPSIS